MHTSYWRTQINNADKNVNYSNDVDSYNVLDSKLPNDISNEIDYADKEFVASNYV